VFLAWMLWDLCFGSAHVMPNALSSLPDSARMTWTVLRVLAAVVTVPIAEELAYRGYLMRVLVARDFETVPFARVRWPALIVASAAFGAMHGAFWLPGIFAGLLYGLIAIRRNSLSEAIVAHATSNALIAATVLIFGRWDLW
jgi:CAAX prenyl protease-like protein